MAFWGTKKWDVLPTTQKPYHMTLKYDEECKETLGKYCEQEKVTRMEAVRRGIKKVKGRPEK